MVSMKIYGLAGTRPTRHKRAIYRANTSLFASDRFFLVEPIDEPVLDQLLDDAAVGDDFGSTVGWLVKGRVQRGLAYEWVNRFPNGRKVSINDHLLGIPSTRGDYLSQFLRIHSPALNTVTPMAPRKYSMP